jgi:hypothetical protein
MLKNTHAVLGLPKKGGSIMFEQKPRLSSLASLGFQVNSVIAEGHGDAVTFNEIYSGLENGTLLKDLDQKLPDKFDFSVFFARDMDEGLSVNYVLEDVAVGLEGREGKVGIKKSGLHLLLAFILEAIQRQNWVIPDKDSPKASKTEH